MTAFFTGRLECDQFHDISNRIIRLPKKRAIGLLHSLGFEEVNDAGYLPIMEIRKATVSWLRQHIKKNDCEELGEYVINLSKAASNRTGTHVFWG